MRQLLQDTRGHLEVAELPGPMPPKCGVLVENRYSLISPGTERAMAKSDERSLLAKTRVRPELVKQVIQTMKTAGVVETVRQAQPRSGQPQPLGYSCAGRVVVSTSERFAPGDRVACAGFGYASHAGFVSVPQNLTARVPENVSERAAATVTLGAIALQGVRVGQPQLGETVAVIGLGLLGQITTMLLLANGCKVIGVDPAKDRADQARAHGAHKVTTQTLPRPILSETGERGVDLVIITATSKLNGPIELAAEICRDKGRIVVVGNVKTDLPRLPFYHKELELRFARSYGPGWDDPAYEEAGQDYPYGYVRWTEQRNMTAYLDLVAAGKVAAESLITHTFPIDDAVEAYQIVAGKIKEPHLGVLLTYPENAERVTKITLKTPGTRQRGRVRIGFLGAGRFATGVLLPRLKSASADLYTICSRSGISARTAAQQFGFAQVATDPDAIFGDAGIDLVFIATPHAEHAQQTIRALECGKAVFVEKPLAVNREELERLVEAYRGNPQPLMVGFNRRFAPLSVRLKEFFADRVEPLAIHYRVLAGRKSAELPWQDSSTGGRIVGELCHFIDYCRFLVGQKVVRISAEAAGPLAERPHPPENLQVLMKFADGSIATVSYLSTGDSGPGKEEVMVSGEGRTAILRDFRSLECHHRGEVRNWKEKEDKGHTAELECVLEALKSGTPMPIPFEELAEVTELTFAVRDALALGDRV